MPYFYYILFACIFFSCNNKPPQEKQKARTAVSAEKKEGPKYVNSVKIVSPEKKQSFRFNENVDLVLTHKDRFPLDSTHLFLNGKLIAKGEKGQTLLRFQLPDKRAGINSLKVTAFHPESKQSTATVLIEVRPDIPPRSYRYKIVQVYPHDPKAYTQGLVYRDGFMYEGTGQYGESGIRKTDMKDGKIVSALNIDSQLFGEGITIFNDKIYQLTWTSGKGFVYDLKTFTQESTFTYNTQGWGLTTYGNKLIMSDGSHKIYHIDPASFYILKEVEVYDHKGPVKNLNELEYIDGLLWANVWLEDRIVLIDPESGAVKGELELSGLLSPAERKQLDDSDDVLNGIAWNPEKGTVYLTGKRWPKMFEVRIDPQP